MRWTRVPRAVGTGSGPALAGLVSRREEIPTDGGRRFLGAHWDLSMLLMPSSVTVPALFPLAATRGIGGHVAVVGRQ